MRGQKALNNNVSNISLYDYNTWWDWLKSFDTSIQLVNSTLSHFFVSLATVWEF